MIALDIKKVIFAIKIIDLNTEIFAKKAIIALIFEIDSSGIYIAIILIN